MKLPIGAIARFALNKIVLPALGKAIASNRNPLTKEGAKQAIEEALQKEARRQLAKRLGH
jgi:hypothetical protein